MKRLVSCLSLSVWICLSVSRVVCARETEEKILNNEYPPKETDEVGKKRREIYEKVSKRRRC